MAPHDLCRKARASIETMAKTFKKNSNSIHTHGTRRNVSARACATSARDFRCGCVRREMLPWPVPVGVLSFNIYACDAKSYKSSGCACMQARHVATASLCVIALVRVKNKSQRLLHKTYPFLFPSQRLNANCVRVYDAVASHTGRIIFAYHILSAHWRERCA